jgi:DNA-binding MarR family transcriptional regulator
MFQEAITRTCEVDMSLKKSKLQVLAILSENLKKTRPQLVSSSTIAEQVDMSIPQLRQVLKCLDGCGEIQTDLDLRYNLITRKGLHLLAEQDLTFHS